MGDLDDSLVEDALEIISATTPIELNSNADNSYSSPGKFEQLQRVLNSYKRRVRRQTSCVNEKTGASLGNFHSSVQMRKTSINQVRSKLKGYKTSLGLKEALSKRTMQTDPMSAGLPL